MLKDLLWLPCTKSVANAKVPIFSWNNFPSKVASPPGSKKVATPSDIEGEAEAEIEVEGLNEREADAESEALGLKLAEGDIEAEGDLDLEGEAEGLSEREATPIKYSGMGKSYC